jgi:hypothetical protein
MMMILMLSLLPLYRQVSMPSLQMVSELIESHNNDVELSYVHQFLADEDIPHLPPGGGLASKKVYIEEIYKKLLPEKFEATDECPNPLASLLFTNAKNAAEAE